MGRRVTLENSMYVMGGQMIYEVVDFEYFQSDEVYLNFNLELVAGWDYIDADYSNAQGYVSKENFVSEVQDESISVCILDETLKDRLEEEGYTIIDINDYTIHESPFVSKED